MTSDAVNSDTMKSDTPKPSPTPRRLAIIGCGSSGLICLKTALANLPQWQVVCFEKSDNITGCWGNPYPGFVSTSTKFTTQFACFPERDATIDADAGASRVEFYRNGEYGEYLNRFADHFELRPYIKLQQQVERLVRATERAGWELTYRATDSQEASGRVTEHFDAVIICTGLAAQAKKVDTTIPAISLAELNGHSEPGAIHNQRIVVFGGGESAVDYAVRLSRPELNNTVYLSLRSGIRVSPRYHPIRGVPSDFLRNRLMLSIHPALRNWIGQRFVEARILHQEQFERWFPSTVKKDESDTDDQIVSRRKEWAYKLTKVAKDELFNMFHNKSEDFLECAARGEITIVGPPIDSTLERFYRFDSTEETEVRPTRIVPAIGYKSTLSALSGESLRLPDFYLGCSHKSYTDLFLVGFARPIIGNIPTISEMQAAYVCGLIAGRFPRNERIAELNDADWRQKAARFPKLDLEAVYPVEMFSYCDELARLMNTYPTWRRVGSLRKWWQMQLSPATTAHYLFHDSKIRHFFARAPVYMPVLLICFLLLLKPFDWIFRAIKWLRDLISRRQVNAVNFTTDQHA